MSVGRQGPTQTRILTMNRGSTTLKAALYEVQERERLVLTISVDRIDHSGGHITIADTRGSAVFDQQFDGRDANAGLGVIIEWLEAHGHLSRLAAAGHRLVHGGSQYCEPERITPAFLAELEKIVPLDPDHLPGAISAIRIIAQKFPELTQVACFDTAFHRSLPKVARLYALPRRLYDNGIRRYGFHGLSYEYILDELRALDRTAADGRVIIAHLGGGASMVAVQAGKSVDTSMGFTPLEGLVMGTRSGDVDPGALIYLLEQGTMSPSELGVHLNKRSGLLGVSGSTDDMRDLLDRAPKDADAAEAVDVFCYRAKKYVGAYAAVLGGLDTLVFSGGIGEHSPAVRERICAGLEFLGIRLDPSRNQANAGVISSPDGQVCVRVIETNEDVMIARHVLALLGRTRPGAV
jgi:acetate kinase